jgi:aromatic ring-cleaving dioxygenase
MMLIQEFNFSYDQQVVKLSLMLNSEILSQEHLFPPGFRREFDAHVYYMAGTRELAKRLRLQAALRFRNHPVLVGDLVDQLVGPHPLPMFEINFPKELYQAVVDWLDQERGEFSILVHEVTGDDPKDHSSGAKWLGKKLVLDESKLDPSPV